MTADQLAHELATGEPARRTAAADALATMGEEARPATCALVEATADPGLRDLCVGALEELGAPPAGALPRLALLLEANDGSVAYWAATLLGRARESAAPYASALEALANRPSAPEYARDRAAWALKKIGR